MQPATRTEVAGVALKRQVAVSGRARIAPTWAVLLFAILVAMLSLLSVPVDAVPALPAGFRDEVVLDGLDNPTNVEFSRDGRVFVAEKRGLIRVFDDLSDPTPTTFANLRTNVHNFWDRGLLGLASPQIFRTIPTSTRCTRTTPRSVVWRLDGAPRASHQIPVPPLPVLRKTVAW